MQSTPKSTIVVIRLARTYPGLKVPFDKLYMVPRAMRDSIPAMFGYAVVMPVTTDLINSLAAIRFKYLEYSGLDRGTSNAISTIVLGGPSRSARAWWQKNVGGPYAIQDRLAVVPVLTVLKNNRRVPTYLAAADWYERQERTAVKYTASNTGRSVRSIDVAKLDPAIPELSYLATPHPPPFDKVEDLCDSCPRNLLRIQNKCVPGQAVCYETLDFYSLYDTTAAGKKEASSNGRI